jgi:hypothetical protein
MKRLTPLLIFLGLIPLAVTVAAILILLPDTVPLHIGFDGIDRYGSKYETLVVGGILTFFCFVLTAFFHNAEKLYALGLVHGTGVRGARIVLLVAVVAFDIVSLATLPFYLTPIG